MRSAVAISVVLLLVTVVTACPLTLCARDSSFNHACCHKHPGEMPCAPHTQVQQCVYGLLERSMPAPAAMAAVAPAVVAAPPTPTDNGPALAVGERPADSRRLHLRMHVLRI